MYFFEVSVFSGEKAQPCSYRHHCVQLSFVFLYARICQSLKLDCLFASPTVPVVPVVLQIDTSIESVTNLGGIFYFFFATCTLEDKLADTNVHQMYAFIYVFFFVFEHALAITDINQLFFTHKPCETDITSYYGCKSIGLQVLAKNHQAFLNKTIRDEGLLFFSLSC